MKVYLTFALIMLSNILFANSIFDPQRGKGLPKKPVNNTIEKPKDKITPLYKKLIGISNINGIIRIKLKDLKKKKIENIKWHLNKDNTFLLANYYHIDRVDYKNRSLILRSKIKTECKEQKVINLSCNENNEYVLKITIDKPIAVTKSVKHKRGKKSKSIAKINRLNNPFVKASKKNRKALNY